MENEIRVAGFRESARVYSTSSKIEAKIFLDMFKGIGIEKISNNNYEVKL